MKNHEEYKDYLKLNFLTEVEPYNKTLSKKEVKENLIILKNKIKDELENKGLSPKQIKEYFVNVSKEVKNEMYNNKHFKQAVETTSMYAQPIMDVIGSASTTITNKSIELGEQSIQAMSDIQGIFSNDSNRTALDDAKGFFKLITGSMVLCTLIQFSGVICAVGCVGAMAKKKENGKSFLDELLDFLDSLTKKIKMKKKITIKH